MASWVHRWLDRHQHPASLLLHAIAIPMLPLAAYLVIVQLQEAAWSLWWRPVGLVVLSYALQWVGHRIEGNDMGEIILLKKLVGRPYVAIAPRRSQGSAIRAVGAGCPTSFGGGGGDDRGHDAERKSSTPPGPKDLGHPTKSSSRACSP